MPRIGNQRHACVADESDFCALFERDHQFGSTRQFVMFVVTDQGLANFVVVQKFLRMAGVFASDLIDLFKDAKRAQSNVFEVANWGADQVQATQCRLDIICADAAHAPESNTRLGQGRPWKAEPAKLLARAALAT